MAERRLRPERRYRRRTVRVLVAYAPARVADARRPEALRHAYATTLGAGGLFVECEAPLPVGVTLRLRFRLAPGEPEHALRGRVAWIQRPDPPAGPEGASAGPRRVPGMGIEFTESEERSALARALERGEP